MKVVIFGATGNTGLCSLEHAVKKGFETRAFVRDKKKIPAHLIGQIDIFVGDVTNAENVSHAVSQMDGVIVALGTRNDLKPTTVLSTGMKNIIDAMKTHNVHLVSVCLSAFLFYKPENVPAIFKDLNKDHQRMFDLTKESGLKWIAVLPPHIADEPTSKYTIKYDESPGRIISKHSLGEFLVESLSLPDHHQQVCGIANTASLK